jgi:glycosyltransferase involved in cell wall biosynthesis
MEAHIVETINISITLCTYNRFEMLRQTLDSLLKQETGGAFSYEIVVVDDGSTDATPLYVQEMISVSPVPIRYFREERAGIAAARNRGVKESRGKWIAFIDDDETAEPDWLQELLISAEATGADCVGGAVKVVILGVTDERKTATLRKYFSETGHLGWFTRRFAYSGPATCNALVRRILFEKIGLFDVSIVRFDDADLFIRTRQAGYRIAFTPKALIHHFIPSDRLSPHYLLNLAEQHGKHMAFFDCREWGCLKAALICGMRIASTGLKAGNVAVKYYTLRHEGSSLLDLKCSIYMTTGYCGEILSQIRTKLDLFCVH